MSGLKLVPLRCGSCDVPLKASAGAVVLLCDQCGSGFEVTPDGPLSPIPVSFARFAKGSPRFFPFWTFEARLRLDARDSDRPSAASGGLAAVFQQRGSLRIYCAAFAEDLKGRWPWSLRLSLDQPELPAAERQKDLGPMDFSRADAQLLASDIFVTSELILSDTVRSLKFELELTEPRLVAIAL